jgi:hypothetical protein
VIRQLIRDTFPPTDVRHIGTRMFARVRRQVDVVVALGVSAQTALRWHRAWVEGDRETLVGAGRAGRMR